MCLDILKPVSTKKGYGFKAFSEGLGNLYPAYFGLDRDHYEHDLSFPINKWFKDPNTHPIRMDDNNKYPAGMHFFSTKQGAEIWAKIHNASTIKKTYYRDVVATGIAKCGLSRLSVIVAREIYIEDKE